MTFALQIQERDDAPGKKLDTHAYTKRRKHLSHTQESGIATNYGPEDKSISRAIPPIIHTPVTTISRACDYFRAGTTKDIFGAKFASDHIFCLSRSRKQQQTRAREVADIAMGLLESPHHIPLTRTPYVPLSVHTARTFLRFPLSVMRDPENEDERLTTVLVIRVVVVVVVATISNYDQVIHCTP